jgi:hypothetical protein
VLLISHLCALDAEFVGASTLVVDASMLVDRVVLKLSMKGVCVTGCLGDRVQGVWKLAREGLRQIKVIGLGDLFYVPVEIWCTCHVLHMAPLMWRFRRMWDIRFVGAGR